MPLDPTALYYALTIIAQVAAALVTRIGSYDAIILGAILTAGSAILFVKMYLSPLSPDEATQTFLGSNPFQVRNAIIQRYETIAGVIWLAGGLLSIILGTLWSALSSETSYLIGPYLDILLLLVAGCIAGAVTFLITGRLSQRVYRPRMIKMQRELFESESFVLSHEGRNKTEVDCRMEASPEVRQSRLKAVSQSLDQIGKLLHVLRGEREIDEQYVKRLKPFFQE